MKVETVEEAIARGVKVQHIPFGYGVDFEGKRMNFMEETRTNHNKRQAKKRKRK